MDFNLRDYMWTSNKFSIMYANSYCNDGIRCFNMNLYGLYTLWIFYMVFLYYDCGIHVGTMKWGSNTMNFYILWFSYMKISTSVYGEFYMYRSIYVDLPQWYFYGRSKCVMGLYFIWKRPCMLEWWSV
jgi:hypothetical protein